MLDIRLLHFGIVLGHLFSSCFYHSLVYRPKPSLLRCVLCIEKLKNTGMQCFVKSFLRYSMLLCLLFFSSPPVIAVFLTDILDGLNFIILSFLDFFLTVAWLQLSLTCYLLRFTIRLLINPVTISSC